MYGLRFLVFAFFLLHLGVPPTQLQKYGDFGCVDERAFQELLAPVLPNKETVFLLGQEKGLAQESPAPSLDLELPASAKDASRSFPVPVVETEDSSQAPGNSKEVGAPPAPE